MTSMIDLLKSVSKIADTVNRIIDTQGKENLHQAYRAGGVRFKMTIEETELLVLIRPHNKPGMSLPEGADHIE